MYTVPVNNDELCESTGLGRGVSEARNDGSMTSIGLKTTRKSFRTGCKASEPPRSPF